MSLTNEGMSPADIGALMGNNGGWGNDGSWWIIILFLFAFMGFGNNGWSNGNAGAMDNYVLASDFATLQRQIDSATSSLERKGDTINAGLCDGFYAMNTGLLNGFSGVNNTITQAQINEMQNANAIQTQIANCCCENKSAIAGVNYNMAMNANATQQAITNGLCQTNFNGQTNTRDIIDAQNANTQAILQAIQTNKVEELQNRIAEQNQQINALQLSASQQAQNNYLISQLRQTPVPAYSVPNPYSGCGCGC